MISNLLSNVFTSHFSSSFFFFSQTHFSLDIFSMSHEGARMEDAGSCFLGNSSSHKGDPHRERPSTTASWRASKVVTEGNSHVWITSVSSVSDREFGTWGQCVDCLEKGWETSASVLTGFYWVFKELEYFSAIFFYVRETKKLTLREKKKKVFMPFKSIL